MHKMTLVVDGSSEVNNPTWNDVIKAIHSMNGISNSMVVLTTGAGNAILIGGGNSGCYLVSYYPNFSGQISYFLSDSSKKGDAIEITVQTTEMFPARWCIHLDTVIDVINIFYKTGQIPEKYQWEEG